MKILKAADRISYWETNEYYLLVSVKDYFEHIEFYNENYGYVGLVKKPKKINITDPLTKQRYSFNLPIKEYMIKLISYSD